jgi:hypothetical protein
MKNAERSSPMRLAAWALVGNLVMASAVLFEVLVLPKLSAGGANPVTVLPVWAFRLVTFGIPGMFGLALVALAVQKLRGGVKKGAWTDAELEALRRRLRNPVWWVVAVPLVIVGVGLVVAARGFDHASWFCFLILPFQTLLWVGLAVKPVESSREHIATNSSAKVQSENWGEPRS